MRERLIFVDFMAAVQPHQKKYRGKPETVNPRPLANSEFDEINILADSIKYGYQAAIVCFYDACNLIQFCLHLPHRTSEYLARTFEKVF
jgi:hypothetical protein